MFKKVTAVILMLGAIVGGYIHFTDRLDTKYALADDLRRTNFRLEQKIIMDQIFYIQRQMQQLQYSCGTNDPIKMPQHARDRYNDFEIELRKKEIQLKNLEKGK